MAMYNTRKQYIIYVTTFLIQLLLKLSHILPHRKMCACLCTSTCESRMHVYTYIQPLFRTKESRSCSVLPKPMSVRIACGVPIYGERRAKEQQNRTQLITSKWVSIFCTLIIHIAENNNFVGAHLVAKYGEETLKMSFRLRSMGRYMYIIF